MYPNQKSETAFRNWQEENNTKLANAYDPSRELTFDAFSLAVYTGKIKLSHSPGKDPETREEKKAKIVAKLNEGLPQFSGSQTFTKYMFGLVLTEGAVFLAETAGAWWLIDLIGSWQLEKKVRTEEFQVWKLKVDGSKAEATCEDGNKHKVAHQTIEYTDFPLPEITLWAVQNELGGFTVMLPSEY